jgi:hypothetical protein
MAVVSFPQVWLPASPAITNGALSLASFTCNASGDRVGFVIQAPKAGTLHSFEFRTSSVLNNPDNGVRLSFQSVAAGDPNGTQSQYRDITGTISASSWQTPPGPLTDDGTDTGVKRTVTKGETFACVVDFVNFVASDSFAVTVLGINAAGQPIVTNQYVADGSSGSYSKNTTNLPILALKYDDGSYGEFDVPIWPILATNSNTFNSGSTPDERALRGQFSAPCRCAGGWARIDLDGPADLVLYDNASSVLASASLNENWRSVNNGVPFRALWSSAVTLSAATTYRLAVKPTSGASIISYDFDVNSAGLMACVSGGAQFYGSTRTNAGAWTDTTTQRPVMGFILDGFADDTAGSVAGVSRARVQRGM